MEIIYKSVFFEPWLGTNYASTGFFGLRVLVLGESHYQWEDVVLDRHTTCKVIQPIVDGSEKRAFWTNIVRAFLNKKACQAEVESFWNSVMFYNYVQESVGKGPRQPPAPAMWTRAEPAFLEILRCHEPACVVVLGRRPWTCLPHRGIAGPQLHLGPCTKDTRVYPTTDGHTALASWIKHPSSGFDPGEQHHWVAALLDAARRQQSHENTTMLRFGTRPVEEPIPLECVCDRCGKKITPDDYIEWEEKYVLRFTAGYGSVFGDGAQVACDLCQACLYELIGPFCRRFNRVSYQSRLARGDFSLW